MTITRRTAIKGGLAASTFAIVAGKARAAEHTFRFASLSPETGYIHSQHLAKFKEAVERDSDGRIYVDLQPAGVFGKVPQLHKLVESGAVDMAWSIQGYSSGRFPQSTVVELPFLYETSATGTQMLMSMYEDGLFQRDYGSIKVLALYTHRPYGMFTTGREVRSVADMAGLKIRTPSAMIGEALDALGATPVGIPVAEMAENLRRGVIDGTVFVFEAIKLFGLQDELKSLTDLKIAGPRFMIFMNKAKYEGLPDDLKAVIDRNSGMPMAMAIGEGLDVEELKFKTAYAQAGDVTVIDVDPAVRAEMIALTEPVTETWLAAMEADGHDAASLLGRAKSLVAP